MNYLYSKWVRVLTTHQKRKKGVQKLLANVTAAVATAKEEENKVT